MRPNRPRTTADAGATRGFAGPSAFVLAQPQFTTQAFVAPTKAPQFDAVRQGFAIETLATKPRETLHGAAASTVETNLQRDRLNKLEAVPRRTLTTPALEGRSYQFGVLDHIQAEVREYEATWRGMRDLIESLEGMFDPVEAASIRRVLVGFGEPVNPSALAADQADRDYPLGRFDLGRIRTLFERADAAVPNERPNETEAQTRLRRRAEGVRDALRGLITSHAGFLEAAELTEAGLGEYATPDPQRRFEAMFQAGQILTRQIAWMEDRYQRLEDELEGRLRERIRLEGVLERLAVAIESAGRRLAQLDATRLELLSDYGIAQALTREDWAAVYRRDRERSRILTEGLRGLYYVRVRETPVSAALIAPLHHQATAECVLAERAMNARLQGGSAALAAVFATVLEVPFADWAPLAPLVPKLPVERVPDLLGLHRYRLAQQQGGGSMSGLGSAGLAARLAPVLAANAQLNQGWSALAGRPVGAGVGLGGALGGGPLGERPITRGRAHPGGPVRGDREGARKPVQHRGPGLHNRLELAQGGDAQARERASDVGRARPEECVEKIRKADRGR